MRTRARAADLLLVVFLVCLALATAAQVQHSRASASLLRCTRSTPSGDLRGRRLVGYRPRAAGMRASLRRRRACSSCLQPSAGARDGGVLDRPGRAVGRVRARRGARHAGVAPGTGESRSSAPRTTATRSRAPPCRSAWCSSARTPGITAGYDHDSTRIDGFSHTHLSGVGCGVARRGAASCRRPAPSPRPSPTRYAIAATATPTRRRAPGYYRVDLDQATASGRELTATTRTGWQRYTFPATGQANVLFNVGRANMPVFALGGRRRRATGPSRARSTTGGFCGSRDRHTVYFSATLRPPVHRRRHLAGRPR